MRHNQRIPFLFEVNDRNACPTKLHMFVCIVGDVGHRMEVLSEELSQDTVTLSMKDPYTGYAGKNGIVNKIGNSIQSLITPHAPHIQILLEVLYMTIYRGACTSRQLRGEHGNPVVAFLLLGL